MDGATRERSLAEHANALVQALQSDDDAAAAEALSALAALDAAQLRARVARLAQVLRAGIQRYRSIAEQLPKLPNRHAVLVEALAADALRELAILDAPVSEARARKLLAFDMELNAQGLEVWLNGR